MTAPAPSPAPRLPIVKPITVVEPQLQLLQAGQLDRVIRPDGGMFETLRPGDRLWVREPFHLHHKWNHLSPTAAARFGAQPFFVADGLSEQDWDLGPRRYARNLLRQWHRRHLLVTEAARTPVQALPIAQINGQGFATRAAFAHAWDRNLSLSQGSIGGRALYRNNPDALVLTVQLIAAPLPELQNG